MASALKCDRCKNYFDYSPATKNFIAFGHKNIIVGKNFPVKDICPNCMEQFMTWFENPDNNDEEYQKALEAIKTYAEYKDPCKSCHNGKCEQCVYGYCSEEEKKNRWLGNHKKVPESPKTIKEYCDQRASSGDPVTVNELKRKFNIQ